MSQKLFPLRNEAYKKLVNYPCCVRDFYIAQCSYAGISHDRSHQSARKYRKARTVAINRLIHLEAMTKQQADFRVYSQ